MSAGKDITVAVTGGRHFDDEDLVWDILDILDGTRGISKLVHGATPTREGADWLADAWAEAAGMIPTRVPVDHAKDGPWPAAGPKRNERMLRTHRPDLLIAFPGGKGTASCVRIAKRLGILVEDLR